MLTEFTRYMTFICLSLKLVPSDRIELPLTGSKPILLPLQTKRE